MTTQVPTSYPVFVVEAERACPVCEYETVWYATPDERPTPARCPKCRTRFWATLNVGDETIELVEA